MSDNNSSDGQQSMDDLKTDNRRLRRLVDKYRSESKSVINKALEWRDKDKTSVLQTLELLRMNAYLIARLGPDSDQVLDDYLNLKTSSSMVNGKTNGVQKPSSSGPKTKDKTNSATKVTANPISMYFKSVDKANGDSESNGGRQTAARSSPRKASTSTASTSGSTNSGPKRKRLEYQSSDTDGDDNKTAKKAPKGRVGSKPGPKSKKKIGPTVSDTDADTTQANGDKSMDKSQESEDKAADEPKPKKKAGPKRTRRPREQGPKRYFPCTFDPKQCDEIMDSKEHLDFHMSGHYDAKYVCPYCAYTGPTIQVIKRHINTEREAADKLVSESRRLNEDQLAHHKQKVYKCFGCKVCNKMHDKLEKRCEHIEESSDNECDFQHDIDYQFKDHLKRHFSELFIAIKDIDKRREKIRPLINKFAEELYFENNAKKNLLVEKYQKNKDNDNEVKVKTEKPVIMSSDDDWDD